MWGSNSSLLREELWVLSPFLIVGGRARAGVCRHKLVSQPLLPISIWDFFLICLLGRIPQLVFRGVFFVCF